MRAVVVKEFKAEPEVIELPTPVPGPGEVLVKVEAAGLNPADWKAAEGAFGPRPSSAFPMILGTDFSGRVAAVGDRVRGLSVGDAVFGQARNGSYAEYVVVAEEGVIAHAPSAIELKTAAAVPIAGMTATAILDRAAIRPLESLLIVGAAGGVGTFLVQLAAARDVRVLAVTRGAEQVRMMLFGAAVTIDTLAENAGDRVLDEYPDGVDALVDLASIDADAFNAYAAMVHDGGVALSPTGAADPEMLVLQGVEGINFLLTASAELLAKLATEIDSGTLKVSVENEAPLEQAPQALARSKSGGARGKTIIVP